MSGKIGSRRFIAVLAALILLLVGPLGAPALADPGAIRVSVILDSPDIMANLNGTTGPSLDTTVTFEVFSASAGGLLFQSTRTAASSVESASFDLADGSYKIRVSATGFVESWYTVLSGRDGDAFDELLGYQERHTEETADAIVVDSLNPDSSSWNSEGWTILHRSASSITGAVGNDVLVPQGSLLKDVAVELYDEAGPPAAGPVAHALTDDNGYYTFADLAPGAYKVRFLAGGVERWWPETPNRAEAEPIILSGTNNFNLAYAIFPTGQAAPDPARTLSLTGQPALGATLTAAPTGPVEMDPTNTPCLQRYSWFIDDTMVDGAFGPTFVVPLDAGGTTVHARLNTAGFGCTYRELDSNPVGPVDPALTLPGEDIVVAPVDSEGRTDVTLTFENVTAPGTTTVTRLPSGDAFPDGGFSSLTDPPLYYDIETTAGFNPDLGAEVCITFDTAGMTEDQAAGQHLYHYVNGEWKDITTTSSFGAVCGLTHSFSPFAVGQPHWPFRGFLQPVDSGGVLNAMKAGAAVPIKFGLDGNRGLHILAAGGPTSSAIVCPGGATPDLVEQTVNAETSSLSYAPGSDTYTFVWKTQKAWAGSCRQFQLRLNDGTVHSALFDFRK